ncbi:unnamed protein product [Ectocarpus sp. 13 AM-2016]
MCETHQQCTTSVSSSGLYRVRLRSPLSQSRLEHLGMGMRYILRIIGTSAYAARPSVVGARPNRCDEECPIFLPQKPADRQSVLYGPRSGRKGGHIRYPGT